MHIYCILLLFIAATPNSESTWEIYRIPLETLSHGSHEHRGINIYYPNNHFHPSRQRSNSFVDYYDYERGLNAGMGNDFLDVWSRNNEERARAQRQQLSPQNPVQIAAEINVCIRNCPTTSEYNPVCGSNGVTYSNPSRLECAKFCGVDVLLSRYSRCPIPGVSPSIPSTEASTLISIVTPVTPTPVTPTPVTPTPVTPTPATPSVTPTRESITQPTTKGIVDFTVPQDILDNIFTTDYGALIDERHEE